MSCSRATKGGCPTAPTSAAIRSSAKRCPAARATTCSTSANSPHDDTPPVLVPEGTVFLMGDNRDNSMDSRFSVAEGGVGMLPQQNLVGRATIMMFSTDGSANWFLPWTWFTAARWNRIGGTF